MQPKKIKSLDQFRPNVLPRLSSTSPEKSSFIAKAAGEMSDTMKREKLLEILSQTDKGSAIVRPDVLKLMERKRLEDVAFRTKREKEMFVLDAGTDIFALPGKPEQSGLLSPEQRKSKGRTTRKLKVTDIAADTSYDEKEAIIEKDIDEFAFLNESLGITRAIKIREVEVELTDTDSPGYNSSDPPSPGKTMQNNNNSPTKQATSGTTSGGSNNTSDLDQIAGIMEGIVTGGDALNFFARFGSETPVKFVHLVQVDDAKRYRPYDLMRVDLQDIPSEYFIMSPAGIVHVCPNEPSECIPLSTWMRQGMMFNILRNIRFYKLFLHRKMFQTWRANVRFQQYSRQRKRVAERLFLTRRTSSKPILSIKRYLMDVQNMNLLQLDLRTADKAVFVEQQVAQCTRASAQFEESMQHIITEVQQVIADITSHHNASLENRDGTGPSSNSNTSGNNNNDSAQSFTDDLLPEKVKSLVKIKQERLERKQTRHFAKIEYRSIPDFIRFVDYLTVETLVSLAVNSANSFYQEFIKTRKSGIFETYVRFSSTGTTFCPTCADIRDALDGLLDTMINTVGNVNRVSYLSSSHVPKGGGNIAVTSGGANIQYTIRYTF